jgi:hypothetical protein
MKSMPLADVRKHTGRPPMTYEEAFRLGGNQPATCIANMALGLSLHTWSNTVEDWRQLEAAIIVRNRRNRRERH